MKGFEMCFHCLAKISPEHGMKILCSGTEFLCWLLLVVWVVLKQGCCFWLEDNTACRSSPFVSGRGESHDTRRPFVY